MGKIDQISLLKKDLHLGLESCAVSDRLPLVMFGGMVEASSFQKVDLVGSLNVLKSFLFSSNSDVLAECIEVLNSYIKQHFLNDNTEVIAEEEVDLLKTACCRILPHWDSDDFRVLGMVTDYFSCIFELLFTTHRFPKSLVDWLSSNIIEKCLLGSPYSIAEPVILSKGSIRLIRALTIHAPLSWVSLSTFAPYYNATVPCPCYGLSCFTLVASVFCVIFERSPHLTTSLLLSLAWNYCAASAGDVISNIMLQCRRNINDWLEHVLTPLANFLMHGVLSCSAEKQLRGLSETDIFEAAKLRLENFILFCCNSTLASLPLGDLYHESEDLSYAEDVPLVQVIVHQLALLLEMAIPCMSHVSEFRLRIFVALLPLLPLNVAVQVTEEHSDLIKVALRHNSDRIRAEMCKSLVALIVKAPAAEVPRPTFYRWVLEGFTSLLSSTDPTARNAASHAFFEMTLNLRNRCSTFLVEEVDILATSQWSKANGQPDVTVSVFNVTAMSHLRALNEIYDFATSLWSRYTTTSDVLSEVQLPDLTLFLKDLLSQPILPPGIPYQQQKMMGMLISNMFKLSFTELGEQESLRRFGFEPHTAKNLQQILSRVIKVTGFPSLNERTTWMQLISSLPNVNLEIQTIFLDILTTYWPQTSSSEWLTPEALSDLLRLAKTWSNIHLPEVYSAGATLFHWILISVTDLNAANRLASDLLANILDLCKGVEALERTSSETMTGLVVQRIMDKPGYGFLTAVDNIFSWFGNRPGIKARFPQSVIKYPPDLTTSDRLGDLLGPRLAECCLQLSSSCLAMIGCPCPYSDLEESSLSHLIAGCSFLLPFVSLYILFILNLWHLFSGEISSFEALGRAITGLTLQAQKITACYADLERYHEIMANPSFDFILTSSILVKWIWFRVSLAIFREEPMDETSQRYLLLIGKQLIFILMACRHKGIVEAAHESLRDYLTISECVNQHITLGQSLTLKDLGEKLIRPDQVIDVCILAVKMGKFSVTRRAAGLWPATKAALMAESLVVPLDKSLLQRWLFAMFELGSMSRDTAESMDPMKHDPPQALALHLIKGAFEDSRLGPVAFASSPPPGSDDWFTAIVCRLALPNFTADKWTIANASLQLFGALMKRLVGPLYSRPKTTVAEVFGRYPSLFKAFLNTFLADLTGKRLSRSAAVPILSLLSRLSPSPNWPLSEESKEEMLDCLRRYLTHRVEKVRRLAGEAFVAFFTPSVTPSVDSAIFDIPGGLQHIFRRTLSVNFPSCYICTSNAISGQLFAVEAWLRGALTSEESSERAKLIDWFRGMKYIIEWTQPESKHWYLAAQMATVLRYVFMYSPSMEKSQYHKEFKFRYTYHQLGDSAGDLLDQSLFSEFHSAFYDLYHTIDNFKHLSSEPHDIFFTSPNNRIEENLLAHLLVNIKCRILPSLEEIVSGKALSSALLRLALNDCVMAARSEDSIICCLKRLTTWSFTETQGSSLLPAILLVTASPIAHLHDTQARSMYTAWWVEHLHHCLTTATMNEHLRLKASLALFVWFDTNDRAPVDDFSDSQLASIMRILFCDLFDESADVRKVTGRTVARIFGLQHPVCLLYGANLILSRLPSFLSNPVDWLVEFLQCQLGAIVNRAENLHKYRSMYARASSVFFMLARAFLSLIISSQAQGVCYEPNEVNPYFDVQLVFNLLFSALRRHNADTKVLLEKAASTLENFHRHIMNEGSLRSAVLVFNSPGFYQASLAKRLASLPI
ncbi:unnamed protein product [Hydatigera taeniaeformis]|uniref:DUF2428 domain-containing protein n=1 Tax=Hydatigena taeniaeformis TaxID=6205 RepID=A0A0R3WHP1_HYDTA|nr:unnamed protein product [Hydatigera taeniaeformis]